MHGVATSNSKTAAAFEMFRSQHPPLPPEKLPANADESKLITPAEGLNQWVDGQHQASGAAPPAAGQIDDIQSQLWAVREADVVYAEEHGSTGQDLETGCLKHTNLTGGGPANCAGELRFLEQDVIALNGASGRYGPRTPEEMTSVAKAFHSSGFGVWSYGFDVDNGVPFRFGANTPEWVK